MYQKLVPDPILILVYNSKQPLHARNYFRNRYFERGLLRSLKKLTLFFLVNPVILKGQSYQKQKGPGTSDQSFFRLQNKSRKMPLLVIYYLNKFDDII